MKDMSQKEALYLSIIGVICLILCIGLIIVLTPKNNICNCDKIEYDIPLLLEEEY